MKYTSIYYIVVLAKKEVVVCQICAACFYCGGRGVSELPSKYGTNMRAMCSMSTKTLQQFNIQTHITIGVASYSSGGIMLVHSTYIDSSLILRKKNELQTRAKMSF